MMGTELHTRHRGFGIGGVVAIAALLVAAMLAATPTSAQSDDSICFVRDRSENQEQAKAAFGRECGQEWNDQLRHQCSWVPNPNGWVCHEFAPDGIEAVLAESEQPPPASESDRVNPPGFADWEYRGDHVYLGWRIWAGTEKVNVYRNGEYIATVEGSARPEYRDFDGQAGDEYYLYAKKDGQFSERSGTVEAVWEELPVPQVRMVGEKNGHISVAWNILGNDTVNIYRNGQYIASVNSPGTVYSDFDGQVGDEYYLVGVKDGRFSKKSDPTEAMGTGDLSHYFGAQIDVGFSLDKGEVASAKISLPGHTASRDAEIRSYIVYRNDRGGRINHEHEGIRLGVSSSTSFVDPNPVFGASYGVLPVRNDGTALSIITVRPDYGKVPLMARNVWTAFWNGAKWVATRCIATSCDSVIQEANNYINSEQDDAANGPGASVHDGVHGALEANGFTQTDSSSHGGIDENGEGNINSTTYSNGDATITVSSQDDPGGETGSIEVDTTMTDAHGKPYYQNTTVYYEEGPNNVPQPVGSVTTVNQFMPHCDCYTGPVERTRLGLIPGDHRPPVPPLNSFGDGDSDSNGGRVDQYGVELNPQTDPDGDGISVFGDMDNDGDGYDILEDPDDSDPTKTPSNGSGSGNGGDGDDDDDDDDEDPWDDLEPGDCSTSGACA